MVMTLLKTPDIIRAIIKNKLSIMMAHNTGILENGKNLAILVTMDYILSLSLV
ncbi:hypothetical protein [Cyanobacterium sp. uoEpiScrs1]|uniref:hypothetical protein n=1 Tax=Cyanobacterium sp. uoEpiScrs1 TaxID=2976343 RepID=UPI0022698ADC|nr:hypothetical protein [Cyanobacterium sp. uoEpiScrs1]